MSGLTTIVTGVLFIGRAVSGDVSVHATRVTRVRIAVGDGPIRGTDGDFELVSAHALPVQFQSALGVSWVVEGEEGELFNEFIFDDGSVLQEGGDQFLLVYVVLDTTHEKFTASLDFGQLDARIGPIDDLLGENAVSISARIGLFEMDETEVGLNIDFLDFSQRLDDFEDFFFRRSFVQSAEENAHWPDPGMNRGQILFHALDGIVDFSIGTLNLEKDFPAFRQLRSLQRFYGILHGFLLLKLDEAVAPHVDAFVDGPVNGE